MRLEFLFQQVTQNAGEHSTWNSRLALQGLLDIFGLIGRNEFKAELLKELDRYATSLHRLSQTPGVDTEKLNSILQEIGQAIDRIHGLNNAILETVRQNDFLGAVRQRNSIPGGTCPFDAPALHFWLCRPDTVRSHHVTAWLQPFQPLQNAIHLLLRLARDSALPHWEVAAQGFYQKALDSTAPNQLVQIILPWEAGVFPIISGSKHRFSLRFMEQPDPHQRPRQTTEAISFQLVCCII
jgi:cell division protein ZapD